MVGPLAEALANNGMDHVTWISADCEGCEYEFIRGFNFTQFDVQIFNYEDNTGARPHKQDIDRILTSHGFKLEFEAGDRLFVRASK